jgi:4'-phosphopantetheinyl transferase
MPNSLRRDVVDIWRVDLESIAPCEYSLAEDECARKFRREIDRQRFLASRTALRRILASYLQVAPQKIAFSYNACGKPFVENSEWQFNVSHCESVALIAMTRDIAVGVDIEKVSEARARRMENLLSPEDVGEGFSTREICERWVRLEALIKARGEGLSVPLPPMRVLESGYSAQALVFSDDFVGALAIAGENAGEIRWRDYASGLSL